MKCQIPQISWHSRDPVLSVDFQPLSGENFRLASGGTDSHVLIWYVVYEENRTVKIECASDLYRHNKSVNVVRFSPSGEYLASGDDEGAMFVWQLKDRDNAVEALKDDDCVNKEDWYPVKLLRGHLEDIYDISWSKDGNFLVSASMDNSAIMWDMQKFVKLHIFSDFKGYVQGVSWDPCNQYIASLSSDRNLRIHNVASKKCVCRLTKAPWSNSTEKGTVRPRLFYDDTLKSYVRRLSYSPDGELLVAPSGIIEKGEKLTNACYVFSRHVLNKPAITLPTDDWYTVAVRFNPFLYQLRWKGDPENIENIKPPKAMINLPYRMIFAVAACDSILMYDTEQLSPFACISNIHFTHLTDLAWSPDGLMLIASSTDGYCSFIIFSQEELGEIYIPDNSKDLEADINMESDNSPKDKLLESSAIKRPKSPAELSATCINNNETPKTPSVTEKKVPKMLSIKKFLKSPQVLTDAPNSSKSVSMLEDTEVKKEVVESEPMVITISDSPLKKCEDNGQSALMSPRKICSSEVKTVAVESTESHKSDSYSGASSKCKTRLDFSDKSESVAGKDCTPPKKSPKMSIKRFFISSKVKKPDECNLNIETPSGNTGLAKRSDVSENTEGDGKLSSLSCEPMSVLCAATDFDSKTATTEHLESSGQQQVDRDNSMNRVVTDFGQGKNSVKPGESAAIVTNHMDIDAGAKGLSSDDQGQPSSEIKKETDVGSGMDNVELLESSCQKQVDGVSIMNRVLSVIDQVSNDVVKPSEPIITDESLMDVDVSVQCLSSDDQGKPGTRIDKKTDSDGKKNCNEHLDQQPIGVDNSVNQTIPVNVLNESVAEKSSETMVNDENVMEVGVLVKGQSSDDQGKPLSKPDDGTHAAVNKHFSFDENASDGDNTMPVNKVEQKSVNAESENDWKLELSQDDDAMEVVAATSENRPPKVKTSTKRRIPLITLSTTISSKK